MCYVLLQNLHLVVEKISSFLGKDLTDQQQANVVKYSTFRNMKQIPQANYRLVSDQLLDHQKGTFMRKGNITLVVTVLCVNRTSELELISLDLTFIV